MNKTLGTWDPTDRHVIFLASNPDTCKSGNLPATHDHLLVAVNDLMNDRTLDLLEGLIDEGAKVLIDSGVFWLTNEHKRAHGITMNEALALAPSEIAGFDRLWDRYLEVAERIGDRAWGYMELDQGGAEHKRITRGRLNDLGVFPIPVWHPLNDGADYFDELAETHDRVCLGNMVQADNPTRVRLLHTLWEKHRKYPDLWVHTLGMNPNDWFAALSVDSADASTWIGPIRWGLFVHSALLVPVQEKLSYEYTYSYKGNLHHDGVDGNYNVALEMAAISMSQNQRSWRHWVEQVEAEFGEPPYPPEGWPA